MVLVENRFILRVTCIAEDCPHYAPWASNPDHVSTSVHMTENAARATARTWTEDEPGHYSAVVYGPDGLAIQ
jgi:hypothetical protein